MSRRKPFSEYFYSLFAFLRLPRQPSSDLNFLASQSIFYKLLWLEPQEYFSKLYRFILCLTQLQAQLNGLMSRRALDFWNSLLAPMSSLTSAQSQEQVSKPWPKGKRLSLPLPRVKKVHRQRIFARSDSNRLTIKIKGALRSLFSLFRNEKNNEDICRQPGIQRDS